MQAVSPRRRRRRSPRFLQIDDALRLVCDRLKHDRRYPLNEELNLFQYNIGQDGAEVLAASLRHCFRVKRLYMGWNAIGDAGVASLAPCLSGTSSIVEVYLENNGITRPGAAALARSLTVNTSIRKLVLQGNQICGEGAKALAQALMTNSTLEELILASNIVRNEGCMAFARMLEKNTSLKLLDLERNGIGAAGVVPIAKALARDNVTLETLDLYGNLIGNEGAIACKLMLRHNQSLKVLDLAVNQITKAGATEIVKGLQKNTGLRRLDFYGNDIEFGGASALRGLLAESKNQTLGSLIIGGFQSSYWSEQQKIDYFCMRNRAGFRFVGNLALPASLWPLLLQKVSQKLCLLYSFLRERPDLFKREASQTHQSNDDARRSKKRCHDEISNS